MKHQATGTTSSGKQTNAYSRLKHSGTTKHSTSTSGGSNPQSMAKSRHQGQGQSGGHSGHQGQRSGKSTSGY